MGFSTTRKLGNFGRRRPDTCVDDIEALIDHSSPPPYTANDSLPPPYTANDSALQMNLAPTNLYTRLLMVTSALRQKLMSMSLHLLALITTLALQLNLTLEDLYTILPHFDCWSLRKGDKGYASYLLSLACLFKLIFPKKTLEDLIREADKPPFRLTQHLCSTFSEELKLKIPTSSTRDFSTHITSIFDALQARRQIATLSCEEFEFTGRPDDILHRVDGKGEELPGGCITPKRFALITGYFVGKRGQFVHPGISMENIIQVATLLPRREKGR
ncbi:hypothetical protein NCS56_01505700 [Fusarium sp. Ph1]|nr:hypothetical protein NCS56_01505700 [Fusarium sp. Ph1]